MATTHVDLHGERLSLEALKSLASQINQRYLPINVNHDIRQPTIGRLVSAEVVKMTDVEYAVDGIGELFEPTDTLESLTGDGRKMDVAVDDVKTFSVYFDRAFRNEEGKELLQELEEISGQKPAPTIKKGLGTSIYSINSLWNFHFRGNWKRFLLKIWRGLIQQA